MNPTPKLEIGSWPTPVTRLTQVSELLGTEVWAKLEDACGAWGGNKVRKLEYILGRAEADGIETLGGFGAGSSNWTSALAFHATRAGFRVEVRLTANEIPPAYARLYAGLGTRVVRRTPTRWYAEALLLPGRDRPGTRWVPLGGSGGEGDIGSLEAGVEIADAVREGQIPRPTKLFVAVGTTGTAAGLAVGAATRGLEADVVGVRAGYLPYGSRVHLAVVTRRLGSRVNSQIAPVRPAADGSQASPGYGRPNTRSIEAEQIAALDGLFLDQTYGAKAFASLIAAARRGDPGPLMFLHTSPGSPPDVTMSR